MSVKTTPYFGIIVRKDALRTRGISVHAIMEALESTGPLDDDFDEESTNNLVRRLQKLGLEYFDEFCEFRADFPEWGQFHISLKM